MTSGFKSSPAPACDCRPHGVLHQSLDLSNPDNAMLWVACCLGFFWFLQAAEFTMNSSSDPSVDFTPADLQVNSSTNLQSFRIFIKCANTDPFQHGCFIFLFHGSVPRCPVSALTNYLHLPWTRYWASLHFQGWPSSVKGPSIFVSASHLRSSWHSWEVLRSQLYNWRCYYGPLERRSWPPY